MKGWGLYMAAAAVFCFIAFPKTHTTTWMASAVIWGMLGMFVGRDEARDEHKTNVADMQKEWDAERAFLNRAIESLKEEKGIS